MTWSLRLTSSTSCAPTAARLSSTWNMYPSTPARSIWLLLTNKWLRWRLCWHSDAASMPTSSFSLSPATRKPLAAASPQDVAFPHRFRWFGRTLPPLAFQRQQCGGDGSARSLEVPPCSARFVLPRHSYGSIQADVRCLNIVRKSKKWSYNQSLKSI